MKPLTGDPNRSIFKLGDTVTRPVTKGSATIHRLLVHLHYQGIAGCPKFIGVEGDQEILSFVEGDTYDYPLSGPIASQTALGSAARLLRSLHDASADFLSVCSDPEPVWMLPTQKPADVICHGDFAPYNVALTGSRVVGVFDFDAAHPGPRVWDLAYSVYCWAPFKSKPGDAMGELSDQIERARQFCDAYGAHEDHCYNLVDTMVLRLLALIDFMHKEAALGDLQFKANLEQEHDLGYLADIDYLRLNQAEITRGLLANS
jgi:hypothetical protein